MRIDTFTCFIILRGIYRKGCIACDMHFYPFSFPRAVFSFFSFCSFYWNSLQLSNVTLLFAFTLKWRTCQACVSLLLCQSSISDLGRKRHCKFDYARRWFWSLCHFQRTSAQVHKCREGMVVYYYGFHKTIIISRLAICLFFL